MTTLDLNNSADRLRAMVRLRGCENGGCWLWFGGTVFGRPPDQAITPLFGFHSVVWMVYEPGEDGGWMFRQRESCHFTDLTTGEAQAVFENPYNGRRSPMFGYVSPIFMFRFYAEGTAPFGKGKTPMRESRMCPDLQEAAGEIWSTEWRRNEFLTAPRNEEFPDASPGSRARKSVDLATYCGRTADVLNSHIEFVPTRLNFVADVPWLQWMFMADRPGNAVWSGNGVKVAVATDLPDDLTDRIEQLHPGFLSDPFGMDATPFGTIAQMRAAKAEGLLL